MHRATQELNNVMLIKDDLFDSKVAPHSFDLVHSRIQIAYSQ